MKTTIQIIAPKSSIQTMIPWYPGALTQDELTEWTDGQARITEDENVVLQEPSQTATVHLGEYIALISGSFFQFTEEEFENRFVEVKHGD